MGHILAKIAVLSLESPIEFHCAEVRAYLLREGMPIGGNDLLIASPLQKIFKGIVTLGKNSVGRYFGFILLLIINDRAELLAFSSTKSR